jgi:transaldolase
MPVNARTGALAESGIALWLDDLSRELLETGRFAEYVNAYSITGATSNPTIFAKALSDSTRYSSRIAALPSHGSAAPEELFLELALADVADAAELLRPVHRRTGGDDGFISFECTPGVAHDEAATVEQALDLARRLGGHPNTMIKVPATDAGVGAIEKLTETGVNVNVTLLFSVHRYEQVADAFIRGLERRAERGLPIDEVRSVASFFVSRVDAKADALLSDDSPLRGRVAILNALAAYRRSRSIFSGERWEALAACGAKPQRPLWASLAPKDPAYRDVLYMESLALPGTVATVPQQTLTAFADHGETDSAAVTEDAERADLTEAESVLDLEAIARELEDEGIAAFSAAYDEILDAMRLLTQGGQEPGANGLPNPAASTAER